MPSRFPNDFEIKNGVWVSQLAPPTTYSDGDKQENYLLSSLKSCQNLNSLSDELASKIKDWPSQYHFTPLRQNLFRGFQLSRHSKVLEIGCGCGAMTRWLGESGAEIYAVEGSQRRAQIARERTRDLPNVQVINANLHDIKLEHRFDVVTLIGVLEYSAKYGKHKDERDFDAVLDLVSNYLKPDGVLLLAIENKFGIKYWAGVREDHSDQLFESIEGYYSAQATRTFGKNEIIRLLSKQGLIHSDFYYPYPDYKLPTTVLKDPPVTDLNLKLSHWVDMPYDGYGKPRLHFFDESLALRELENNQLFGEFANSFFILASKSELGLKNSFKPFTNWTAIKFSLDRKAEHQTVTTLEKIQSVWKTQKRPIHSLHEIKYEDDYLLDGEKLSLLLLRALRGQSHSRPQFWSLYQNYYQFLKTRAGNEGRMSPSDIDLTPPNIFVDKNDNWKSFDHEWNTDLHVTPEYVLFRSALIFWSRYRKWIVRNLKLTSENSFVQEVFNQMGLHLTTKTCRFYYLQEHQLQNYAGADLHNYSVLYKSNKKRLAAAWLETCTYPWEVLKGSLLFVKQLIARRKTRQTRPPTAKTYVELTKTETQPVQNTNDTYLPNIKGTYKNRNNQSLIRRLFLLDHLYLLENFIVRNLKIKYRRSYFGFLWTLLHPLLLGSVFYFLFKYVAKIQIPNFGAFVVVSLIPWSFVAQSLADAAEGMYINSELIRKVYLPREIFPLANVITNFINLLLATPVLFLFAWFSGISFTTDVIWLIPCYFILFFFTYFVGLLLSVLNVFYRDVKHILGILTQLLFYGTPVIYSSDLVPEPFNTYILWNPLTPVFETLRAGVLGTGHINPVGLLYSFAFALIVGALSYTVFKRFNKMLAEYV